MIIHLLLWQITVIVSASVYSPKPRYFEKSIVISDNTCGLNYNFWCNATCVGSGQECKCGKKKFTRFTPSQNYSVVCCQEGVKQIGTPCENGKCNVRRTSQISISCNGTKCSDPKMCSDACRGVNTVCNE